MNPLFLPNLPQCLRSFRADCTGFARVRPADRAVCGRVRVARAAWASGQADAAWARSQGGGGGAAEQPGVQSIYRIQSPRKEQHVHGS
jgi:hypothetical protein